MNILVTQHAPTEDLGWWGEFFDEVGAHIHWVRAHAGEAIPHTPTGYSAVISLGGPMNVDEEDEHSWLRDENILIQNCLREGTPFMGLCLGAQLLAKAAGARVVRSPQPEIGWLDVKLNDEGKRSTIFQGLPSTYKVLQWHGDMFEIPANGVNLAWSEACPHQALQVGERAWGLQFHLEVSPSELEIWTQSDDWFETVPNAQSGEQMRQTARELQDITRLYSRQVFSNFVAFVER